MEKDKRNKYLAGLDNIYVEPMKDGTPMYNIKKVYEYCKKNNLNIEKVTEDELKPFLTGYYKNKKNKSNKDIKCNL